MPDVHCRLSTGLRKHRIIFKGTVGEIRCILKNGIISQETESLFCSISVEI